jgi:hypothetical protein
MKKILVLQIKIGNKDFSNIDGLEKYFEFEKNVCLPSVKNWAKKCGYDYKLITESSIKNNNFFKTEQHKYSSERLMNLYYEDYDYIIYFDADVYVNINAPEFPIIEGFSSVEQPLTKSDWNYRFKGIDSTHLKHINAGVYSVDKETGKKIFKYFLNRLQSNDNINTTYGDQDILNAWQFKNGCNFLDKKWNYLLWNEHIDPRKCNTNSPHSKEVHVRLLLKQNYSNLRNANFIHFAGNVKTIFSFFYDIYHNQYNYKK